MKVSMSPISSNSIQSTLSTTEDAMMPPVLLPKSQSFHTLLLLTISMSIRANALMPLTAEHGEAFMSADLLDTEHGVVTKWSTPSKRDTASN
jgi:hypothetical protein